MMKGFILLILAAVLAAGWLVYQHGHRPSAAMLRQAACERAAHQVNLPNEGISANQAICDGYAKTGNH